MTSWNTFFQQPIIQSELEKISQFKKPIIFSTGASNATEINNVYKLLVNKKIQIGILHCILSYPTQYKDANLGLINFLKTNRLVVSKIAVQFLDNSPST